MRIRNSTWLLLSRGASSRLLSLFLVHVLAKDKDKDKEKDKEKDKDKDKGNSLIVNLWKNSTSMYIV